ncbi:hypothetical protein HN51_051543 [Arachis hypogaea]
MPGHRDGVRVYWYPWERDSSGLFPSSQGACSPFPERVFLRGPRSGPWGGPTSLGASSPSGNVLPRLTACRGSNFDAVFPKHLSNIRDHSVDEIRPRHTCWPSTPGQALSMPRPGTPAAQSRSSNERTGGKRAAGARVASSPDSDLEAFSHNPTHGSFAPLAFQPSAMTNCANQRFLSY